MFHDQRVAPDIPARLQPDAGMHTADRLHLRRIIAREITGGDALPMAELRLLGVIHMGIAGEEVVHLRALAHDGVELVERRPHLLLDEGLQAAQPLQRGLVKTEIVQAARDIGVLAGSLRGWLHGEGILERERREENAMLPGQAARTARPPRDPSWVQLKANAFRE